MFMKANAIGESGTRLRRTETRPHDGRHGRFMQPDPLGYDAGTNLYAYVANDPVNATDPEGLTPTQRICTGTKICPQQDGGGGSGMFGASGVSYGGHFALVGAGGPATGTNGSIEITSAYVWVKDSFAFNLFGGYMVNVVGPAAEEAWEKFRKGVNQARCEIGKAGVITEETGTQVTSAGGKVVTVGAGTAVVGAATGNPEVSGIGIAIVGEGAVVMGMGGLGSLIGAGMRAVGGDYGAFVGRGAVNRAGSLIPNPAVRSVSTNTANQGAAPASKGIPTCG